MVARFLTTEPSTYTETIGTVSIFRVDIPWDADAGGGWWMAYELETRYQALTRAAGFMQALGGAFEVGAGAGLTATDVGVVPGVLLVARGADNVYTGLSMLVTG